MSACWPNCCCMGLLGVEPTADTGLFTTAFGVILLAIDTDVDGETDSLADGEVGCAQSHQIKKMLQKRRQLEQKGAKAIATRLSHWCDN